MKSFVSFLEDIEKLAYKILLWVILIPKTIVKITIDPDWAPGYVEAELKPEEKTRFAEYFSPVMLLLFVAFIPAFAYYYFLPVFGTTISSSAEKEATTNRSLVFDSETNFISGSKNLLIVSSWYIEEITGHDESGNNTYREIYREDHNSAESPIEYINNNATLDQFFYPFEPGEYYVNVSAEKIDVEKNNAPLEKYYSYLWVYVPGNPEEQIQISNSTAKSEKVEKKGFENITDQLKKESSFFLAGALLIPPLLFALAIKLSKKDEITETSLRDSFYAQCYYFSIIALAFWASSMAKYFYTPDIFGYKTYNVALLILYLPLLLAAIWFVGIETRAVAVERRRKDAAGSQTKVSAKSPKKKAQETPKKDFVESSTPISTKEMWKAFLIVLICIAALGALSYLAISFSNIKDNFRVLIIRAYPVAAGALLLVFVIAQYKRRKKAAK